MFLDEKSELLDKIGLETLPEPKLIGGKPFGYAADLPDGIRMYYSEEFLEDVTVEEFKKGLSRHGVVI